MGKPKGSTKTGGRKKGSKNKATAAREKEIKESGLTPLDYMLEILRDDKATGEDRKWAAGQAAPYCHSKLSTVDHSGSLNITHEEALEELE